ncbi:hypothetical protein E1264_21125 [Actinomadura sp. KC216]|uniref:hypothetical protein n=1 Tax=Actinomadura sp. KC216 TaxID=2530370 RepID=UPI00105397D3|nr:hypothetical protein [Actinomadura sp. KC216]TDB85473.1 hypothetical protein E1264_21125 [Actinomadura sp. KC216]
MSNTLIKSASSWTAACSGASISGASAAYADALGARPRDLRPRDLRGPNQRDLRELSDLRVDQRFQDQGRSVFDHLLEGMTVQAPATAHVGVTITGDVSGPYPWRQPV